MSTKNLNTTQQLAVLQNQNAIDSVMQAIERITGLSRKERRKKKEIQSFSDALAQSGENLGKGDDFFKILLTAIPAIAKTVASGGTDITSIKDVADIIKSIPLATTAGLAATGAYIDKSKALKDAEAPLKEHMALYGSDEATKALRQFKDKKSDVALTSALTEGTMEYFMPTQFGFDELFGKEGIGKGWFKNFAKDEAGDFSLKELLGDAATTLTLGVAPTYTSDTRIPASGEFVKGGNLKDESKLTQFLYKLGGDYGEMPEGSGDRLIDYLKKKSKNEYVETDEFIDKIYTPFKALLSNPMTAYLTKQQLTKG